MTLESYIIPYLLQDNNPIKTHNGQCCIFTTFPKRIARDLRAHPPRGVPKQNQNLKIFRPPTPPFARRLQTYTYSVRFRHRLARIRKWQYDRGGTPKKTKTGTKQS